MENDAIRSRLLRQPDLAHQFGKPRIRAQRGKWGEGFQTDQQPIVLPISNVEPAERLIFIPHVSIQLSNLLSREVALNTLGFPECNRFRERALPSRGTKSLIQSIGKPNVLGNAVELAADLEFFDHLRIHVFRPISFGQAIMTYGERRLVGCQLLAYSDRLVVSSCGEENTSELPCDDGGLGIELTRAIDFSKSLLLSAANPVQTLRVPLVGSGVVWVEF